MFFNRFGKNTFVDNSNYKYIMQVIDRGMSINKYDLREDQLQVWLDYAKRILELCTPQSTNIQIDFLRLISEAQIANLSPSKKLNAYLKYLIQIAKYI